MNTTQAWLYLSWALLIGSTIAWPISALTFAKHEPQTILALSWAAILISALGNVLAATVNNKIDDEPEYR